MFTGIVEAIGKVATLELEERLLRLVIDAGAVAEGVSVGDSIAVCGACLTVTEVDGERLSFDAVRETLERTSLGSLEVGAAVNLERAMRADGRFDGHIVQGHVDATGRVAALEREGDDVRFAVDCEAGFTDELIEKGSVTIEGVALTVCNVEAERFDVVLIPYTLEHTTLGARQRGDPVNLEADVLGKYVKRHLERMAGGFGSTPPR